MNDIQLPEHIFDKIYEIETDDKNIISKVISYFPLSDDEKKEFLDILGQNFRFNNFNSIFSDSISDEEWEQSKTQIKMRFRNELFDIDKT